jgi:hypothetical protein
VNSEFRKLAGASMLACGLIFAGCASKPSAPGPQTSPEVTASGAGAVAARWQAPKPIAMHGSAPSQYRVSKRISARAGGVLETVDASGTRYRLRLPPGALAADTTVSVTPLANLAGLPGQKRAYGVDIAPAGTLLRQLAYLEISPREKLPAIGAYWLETKGQPAAIKAQLGFPAKGEPGMTLIHFSGGGVGVGGVAAARAAVQSIGDPNHVVEKYDGMRDVAASEYAAGKISKENYDRISDIADSQIEREAANYRGTILDESTAKLDQTLDDLGAKADKGDLSDLQAFQDASTEAAMLDRQNALNGHASDLSAKSAQAMDRYMKALLAKCDKQPLTPDMVISMQRRQLAGGDIDAEALKKCLPKVFEASGGGEGLSVSGQVTDLTQPFELHGTFPGGTSTHHYTPTSDTGGTSSYQASGSGVTASGNGTYTLRESGGNVILVDTSDGCVNGVGSCKHTTATITLTRSAGVPPGK